MSKEDWLTGFGVLVVIALLSLSGILLVRSLDNTAEANCYAIKDANGGWNESLTPPVPVANLQNVWVYKTEPAWGYVIDPIAIRIDRDCLRDHGVDVEPIEGVYE